MIYPLSFAGKNFYTGITSFIRFYKFQLFEETGQTVEHIGLRCYSDRILMQIIFLILMNVLVACEESQAVCLAFRKLGHNAFSCDLQECSGGHPEYHFKGDMFDVIANRGGTLENGTKHFLDSCWDLVIAHPPCTFLLSRVLGGIITPMIKAFRQINAARIRNSQTEQETVKMLFSSSWMFQGLE